MSKTKQKTHSKTEHLEGQIKTLKSQNRQLRRRLKELEKQSHFYENIVDEVVDDVNVKNICKSCKKGTLQEIDLKHVIITACDTCDYKRKRKPRNGKT
jgi:ribosomal protein L44E